MARQTLRTFFMVLLDINVYKKELEAKCIEQDEQVLLLQGQVAVLKENSNLTEAQQRQVMKRQHQIRDLVTRMGSSIDEIDNVCASLLVLWQHDIEVPYHMHSLTQIFIYRTLHARSDNLMTI